VNNVKALAELVVPAPVTAQHLLGYELRLAQQWRWWVLERQLVHLGQPYGSLSVICKEVISSYIVSGWLLVAWQ
jgi:hypothetical protein